VTTSPHLLAILHKCELVNPPQGALPGRRTLSAIVSPPGVSLGFGRPDAGVPGRSAGSWVRHDQGGLPAAAASRTNDGGAQERTLAVRENVVRNV
jgi:hypothetical protein